jgi:hypothetical protein
VIDDIEIRCKKIFKDYLKKEGFKKIHVINRSKQKKDPPDFDFFVDEKKYAVEVTQTKSRRKAIIDNELVIEKTYRYNQFNFIKNIEKNAIEEGLLNGVYCVNFFNPIISKKLNKIKNKIKQQIIDYIKETKKASSYGKKVICIENKKIASIFKSNIGLNKIYPTEFQALWPESPEKIGICRQMIEEAIKEKKIKFLKNKINYPGILLLVNVSSHCTIETFMLCKEKRINEIKNIEFFEAIFIIYDTYSISPFYIYKRSILNK